MKFLCAAFVVLLVPAIFAPTANAVDLYYSGAAPVIAPASVGRGEAFTVSGFHVTSATTGTFSFRVGVYAVWTEFHTVHRVLCGSRTVSRSLTAGSPYLVPTINCTVQDWVRLGWVDLQVKADDLDAIVETNETNNAWTGSLYVAGPDLQFANVPLLTPATVEPGGTLTVNAFDVQNSSSYACAASRVGLYLANTNNVWDQDLLLGTIDIPGIAGGASVPVSQVVYTLPPRDPLVLGTDYVVVYLDMDNAVEEADEANNLMARPFTCTVLDHWTEIPVTLDMDSSPQFPVITSLAWGDYDHDGAPDLMVGDLLISRGHLLHNDGSGHLTEVLPSPVSSIGNGLWADRDNNGWPDLAGVYLNEGWGELVLAPIQPFASGVWADFDRDGLLDFFQSNRNQSTPAAGNLYRNLDGNVFALAQSTPAVFGSAASWGDYDNDGYPDLYQSADRDPDAGGVVFSKLFHNVAGTLVDVTPPYHYEVSWGAEWGDYNNDGQLELLDYGRYGTGIRSFTGAATIVLDDISAYTCSGGSGADYDNDGDLDLALGAIRIVFPDQPQGLLLYVNDGTDSFPPASSSPLNLEAVRQVTWADIDQDGDLDLCAGGSSDQGLRLYRNDRVPYNRWLQLELHGTASNASAIGARVTCYAGGRTMIREVNGGFGSPDLNPFTVSFGLGTADVVDSLVIRWPSGIVQRLAPIQPVDRRLHLVEDAHSTGVDEVPRATGLRLHAAVPNPFNPSTTLRFDVPADGRVHLAVYDLAGRRICDLVDEDMTAGPHEATWAGLDDAGRGVPSGVYSARLESAAGAVGVLMVLVR